jgi:hypothetical protein
MFGKDAGNCSPFTRPPMEIALERWPLCRPIISKPSNLVTSIYTQIRNTRPNPPAPRAIIHPRLALARLMLSPTRPKTAWGTSTHLRRRMQIPPPEPLEKNKVLIINPSLLVSSSSSHVRWWADCFVQQLPTMVLLERIHKTQMIYGMRFRLLSCTRCQCVVEQVNR